MAHNDQFTATGPSNVGSGFPRAAFSDNNQSGTAPQDFVGGVNVQGSEFGVYGECLPAGSVANAATDRKPPALVGVSGRAVVAGTWGEGRFIGVVGVSIRDNDPNQTPNAVLIGCLGGLQNEHNTNTALIGVLGQGSIYGVLGTSGTGIQPPPLDALIDGVLGVVGTSTNPDLHGAGVHGATNDPLGRGGLFESFRHCTGIA
jgi:hypothetical protein